MFSPRGNTFNTETVIFFQLANPASATVKVYNVAGYLVRLLAYNRIVSEGMNALAWNGRDNDNEIVPTGAYIVAVTIGDKIETKVISVYNRQPELYKNFCTRFKYVLLFALFVFCHKKVSVILYNNR